MYKLVQKIKIYKNLIIAFWTLNIMCLFVVLVCGWNYYRHSDHFSIQGKSSLQILISIQKIENLLIEEKEWTQSSRFNLWQSLKSVPELENFSLAESAESIISQKPQIEKILIEVKNRHLNQLVALHSQIYGPQQIFILISLLTFIFGIVIPLFLFWLLSKTAWFAKNQTEKQVRDWFVKWNMEVSKYKDPFKNANFWSKILLITIHHFGGYWNHPMGGYAADISNELLRELKKQNQDDDAA